MEGPVTWFSPRTQGEPLPQAWGHCACQRDGTIYIYSRELEADSCRVHMVSTRDWHCRLLETRGEAPPALDSITAVLDGEKWVFFGGSDREHQYNDVYVLNLATRTWTRQQTRGEVPLPREAHAAALLGQKMYVFGGNCTQVMEESCRNELHCLDLRTWTWTRLDPKGWGQPPPHRDSHAAVAWAGRLLVACGEEAGSYCNDVFAYDPSTRDWAEIRMENAADLAPRACVSVLPTPRGLVLFAGMTKDDEFANDCWLLELGGPGSRLSHLGVNEGRWTPLQQLGRVPSPRCMHAATALGNLMFVSGGTGAEAEVFADLHVLQLQPNALTAGQHAQHAQHAQRAKPAVPQSMQHSPQRSGAEQVQRAGEAAGPGPAHPPSSTAPAPATTNYLLPSPPRPLQVRDPPMLVMPQQQQQLAQGQAQVQHVRTQQQQLSREELLRMLKVAPAPHAAQRPTVTAGLAPPPASASKPAPVAAVPAPLQPLQPPPLPPQPPQQPLQQQQQPSGAGQGAPAQAPAGRAAVATAAAAVAAAGVPASALVAGLTNSPFVEPPMGIAGGKWGKSAKGGGGGGGGEVKVKARTSYNVFQWQMRPLLKQQNPALDYRAIETLISNQWQQMSEEEKAPFQSAAKRHNESVAHLLPKRKRRKVSSPTPTPGSNGDGAAAAGPSPGPATATADAGGAGAVAAAAPGTRGASSSPSMGATPQEDDIADALLEMENGAEAPAAPQAQQAQHAQHGQLDGAGAVQPPAMQHALAAYLAHLQQVRQAQQAQQQQQQPAAHAHPSAQPQAAALGSRTAMPLPSASSHPAYMPQPGRRGAGSAQLPGHPLAAAAAGQATREAATVSGGGPAPTAGPSAAAAAVRAPESSPPLEAVAPPDDVVTTSHPLGAQHQHQQQQEQEQQQQQQAQAGRPEVVSLGLYSASREAVGCRVEGTIDGVFGEGTVMGGYTAIVELKGVKYRAVLTSPFLALQPPGS